MNACSNLDQRITDHMSKMNWNPGQADRKSKPPRSEGAGQEIAVVRKRKAYPITAITAWLDAANVTDGRVFYRIRRGVVVLSEIIGARNVPKLGRRQSHAASR